MTACLQVEQLSSGGGVKIIFSDFDDLHINYRAYKVAHTFVKKGHEVVFYGLTERKKGTLRGWSNIDVRIMKISSLLPFKIKIFFFWFKLFCNLLVSKADILYCHDIYPLLPMFLVSRIKKIPYIYDSHEFWHGNHHIEERKMMKLFWTGYEKIFIKRAGRVITVSASIAAELERIYGLDKVEVITNVPAQRIFAELPDHKIIYDIFKIDASKKIVLYQGGLLFNNGLDTVIKSFQRVDDEAVLVLIGNGVEKNRLKQLVKDLKLEERIFFKSAVPQSELYRYTSSAYLGLCLIKNSGKSFYYSTPNKMFEYIQSGIPQISSSFPEIHNIVQKHKVGITIDPDNELEISAAINLLLHDVELYGEMKRSCASIKDYYSWEKLEDKLEEIVVDALV